MNKDIKRLKHLEATLRSYCDPEIDRWADEIECFRRELEKSAEEDWQRCVKELAPAGLALAKLIWDVVNYFINKQDD